MALATWELMSYVVTVVGLPLAILVFLFEQRKERENEDEELYQLLSDNYQDFLKVALDNPDLRLFSAGSAPALNAEQKERQLIIFNWNSWEDYVLEWCRRPDFRASLPSLLHGEDPGFVRYVERLHAQAQRS